MTEKLRRGSGYNHNSPRRRASSAPSRHRQPDPHIQASCTAIVSSLINGTPLDNQQVADLEAISIDSLKLNYHDTGLAIRYKRFVDSLGWRLPGQPSQSEPSPATTGEIANHLRAIGINNAQAIEMATQLAAFSRDPIGFNVRLRGDPPIRLGELAAAGEDAVRMLFARSKLDS